ncbi:asparagine N-glycosylation enzyme membrane subunit Stt3 [Desulfobaculum xiamenense]|uniref:Asparagine N-glycosylation enzyme membrane subunit Stt3 n=1 Tax=Desulfobaculum xiamenense TaxID=995050 RepID=A0A846QKS8_9BACT|nr:hypothetical protein [Desulfobaculum xiamenense]NJB68731.1 asparagine N-glycosylation enzyme membrane subunit Stt3 [Desulfobaculum xiamenense]
MNEYRQGRFWGGLDLREGLLAGLCALLIVVSKLVFRMHLKVPGHSMFFVMFFLLVARGLIDRRFAATVTALLAGLLAVALAAGKGGPLVIINFMLPGLLIDFAAIVCGDPTRNLALCGLVGGVAAFCRFPAVLMVDWLVGMEMDVALPHVLVKSLAGGAFGLAGALLVPSLVRRVRRAGLVPVRNHG